MPLPTPNKEENKQDFISRCMSDEKMKEEFEGNGQRYSVCERQWGESKDE